MWLIIVKWGRKAVGWGKQAWAWGKKNPKVLIGVAAIAVALGAGYMWGKGNKPPVDMNIDQQTQQTAKSHTDTNWQLWASLVTRIDRDTTITTTTTKKPDGTVEEKRVEVIKDKINSQTNSGSKGATKTETKVVTKVETKVEYKEKPASNWRVTAKVGGSNLDTVPDVFGAGVERRLVSKLWVGVGGDYNKLTGDKTGFVTLSVEF